MPSSALQEQLGKLLHSKLEYAEIHENHRPSWLDGLELDFYLPNFALAFEVQGIQHFRFTPLFHKSIQDFHDQLERDRRKKNLCIHAGIDLIEIFCEGDLDLVDQLPFIKETIDRKYDTFDDRRNKLRRIVVSSKKPRACVQALQKLADRLNYWRKKPDSEEKKRIIQDIGGKISEHSSHLTEWFDAYTVR